MAPRILLPDHPDAQAWLARACGGTQTDGATYSASRRLSVRQLKGLYLAVPVALALWVWQPLDVAIAVIAVATCGYLAMLSYRVFLLRVTFEESAMERVTDDDARAAPDAALPVFTVMVPAFQEPEMMAPLVESLGRLEYPEHLLDIKLLLEEGDDATLQATLALDLPPTIEVVVVPRAEPTTKPKALNYGLCTARGAMVTIYDAEDHPEPLQLRRAAVAMGRLPETVACLQARLVYHNPMQNLLTRWFAGEYLLWFSGFLPGLVSIDAPLPLGGTSNHFRRQALDRTGGWDPFNVTEDADLGLRLHRAGYQVRVLDSVTYEEANSDVVNWVKQRSRWYKGYLQTWLVHMRHPRQLQRDLGWRGVLGFCLFVGGTPALAALNPVFWGLTLLWFLRRPAIVQELFPGPMLYLALISLVVGNLSVIYAGVVAIRQEDPRLVSAAFLQPLYWVLMSVAAAKAVWQLVFRPSHWEKTTHGLSPSPPPTSARSTS
jgi:cellulose synthase/poly-beta-1,6-N-acetylglucosamine synthase-like glycosyltransferase